MKHLIKNIKIFTLLFLAFSIGGCEDDDVKLPEVIAGFTQTISQATGTVTFINTSEDANSYSWDFGDSTSSNLISPTKVYASGTYTVILTATNSAGDSSTFEDTITIAIPEAITIPFNFDEELVVYEATTFNGPSFEVVENPDPSGTNATVSNVGAITNIGAAFEGLFFSLGAPLDLTVDKTITMNFWSNVSLDVLVKLEQGSAADTETSASHAGSGWEELIFTFDSAGEYSQITMFVDGPGMTAGTFYFDDVMQVPTIDLIAPVITLTGDATLDVAVGTTYTDAGATATDNFDGDISANIAVGGDTVDADTVGIYVITYNVSDAAGNAAIEVTRTVNVIAPPAAPTTSAPVPPARDAADVISIYGETYTNVAVANYDPNWGQSGHTLVNTAYDPGDGNLVLAYPSFNYQGTDLAAAQDATAMEFLHVDIWVSADTDRLVKVSPISGGEFLVEVPVTPGSWNSVDIPVGDFTGLTLNAVGQMKFDGQFNSDGSANTTPYDIYLDNIYFHKEPGTSSPSNLILDYENNLTGIGVDAFESGGALIPNPVSGGINTSPNVYEITYTAANQWWGGVGFVVGSAALSETDNEYTAKLYSTVAPINVLFEVEQNGVGGTTIGNIQEISTANQWVEVTFTLQGGAGIDRVLVRPAVGDQTGTKTDSGILYVDDISSTEGTGGPGGGTGACTGTLVSAADFPVDFEGCETFMASDGSVKFGDAISAELAANPDPSGINTSGFVLKVDKPAGASHWEGIQNVFAADFDSSLTFKVKIYSTLPNIDFQFEISNDPNDPGVGNPTPIVKTVTTANVWTDVEVTFTGVPPGGHNNFVIKPNDTGGGTVPTTGIFYFDDVRLE